MVSVEKYPCFCGAGVKQFKSKDDRSFLTCREETCTFFIPADQYTNLMDVFETKVLKQYKPNKFPMCNCEDVASLWVSHSSSNPDRPYFRCQETDANEKCDFFQWADVKSVKKTKRKRNDLKKVAKGKRFKKVQILESSDEED